MEKYSYCTKEILADNIKKYRQKKKISQEKLSELINTEPHFVSQLENCKLDKIYIDFIGKIADAFNISVDKLFIDEFTEVDE